MLWRAPARLFCVTTAGPGGLFEPHRGNGFSDGAASSSFGVGPTTSGYAETILWSASFLTSAHYCYWFFFIYPFGGSLEPVVRLLVIPSRLFLRNNNRRVSWWVSAACWNTHEYVTRIQCPRVSCNDAYGRGGLIAYHYYIVIIIKANARKYIMWLLSEIRVPRVRSEKCCKAGGRLWTRG